MIFDDTSTVIAVSSQLLTNNPKTNNPLALTQVLAKAIAAEFIISCENFAHLRSYKYFVVLDRNLIQQDVATYTASLAHLVLTNPDEALNSFKAYEVDTLRELVIAGFDDKGYASTFELTMGQFKA